MNACHNIIEIKEALTLGIQAVNNMLKLETTEHRNSTNDLIEVYFVTRHRKRFTVKTVLEDLFCRCGRLPIKTRYM